MSLPYPKPALSYRQQADQLMARGLAIADLDAALERLRHCNYYRLGAYWLPFEADHATHRFKPGASFEQVIHLPAAESLRTRLVHALGHPSLDRGAMDFPADGRYAALLPLAPRAATWEDPA